MNTEIIIAAAAVSALILFSGLTLRMLLKRRRGRADLFEDMEGREFEYFCAELLEQRRGEE